MDRNTNRPNTASKKVTEITERLKRACVRACT